ncbi:MAG: hypothetical protein LUD03_06460 [Firmicutes bacterium]|nr:hypothetical protein [Bacillota bacterium]
MIIEYKRSSAFICPFCSEVTTKNITPFNFSGNNMIRYICSTKGCREECGRTISKNGKYVTDVECPICGALHSYTTKYNNFWHNANIIYRCPNSDVSVFFIGNNENIKVYPEKMLKEYTETFELFDDTSEISPILPDMIDCLNQLNKCKKISCVCGSKNILYTADGGDIILACRKCRRQRTIEINETNLAMLLNAEAITIEN